MDYRELLKKYMIVVFARAGADLITESLIDKYSDLITQDEFDELCKLTDENGYAGKYALGVKAY